jgi:hypothetical protein
MLEVHLRYVRQFLRDAATKVPPELRADFEGVLQKIGTTAAESPGSPSGQVASGSTASDHSSMLASPDVPGTAAANSQQSMSQQVFLERLVQLTTQTVPGGDEVAPVTNLFNLPLSSKQQLTLGRLPSRRRATVLIDALFDSQLPMLAFLHERYFRDMVDMVYETDTLDQGIRSFRPLLHFALALGALFVQEDHGSKCCQSAQDEAMQQYLTGQELLEPLAISNLTALQTVLCAVVFLISTCRMTTAHSFIGLACSLGLRLGLHAKNTSLPLEEQLFRARACAAVLHVDALASLVLGLPTFIQAQEVDLSVLDHLASEAYKQQDWQTMAGVAQLKLLFACRLNGDAGSSLEASMADAEQRMVQEGSASLKGWRDHVSELLEELQGQQGGLE